MSKQSDAQKPAALDPFEAGRQWLEIAEKAQKVMTHFVDRQLSGPGPEAMPVTADPMAISRLFTSVLSDPARLGYAQFNFWQRHAELWQRLMKADKTEQPQTKDRRFRSEEWQRDIAFNTLMHTYLIGADWLRSLLTNRSDLPVADQKKLAFFAEQLIDATAPTNFALTNPDVVRKTLETGGANLLNGFSNFLDDLASDAGHVRRADQEAFELGVSIAATKGSVVLRTDMMELIQYEPTTEKVCKIPLLLLPPWVNKYYLFDLQPKSSFIKWAVDQGFTVFAISWVNPDASHARKDFEDYWLEGPQTAFEAIEKATGQKKVNLFGYCLGGTLTAAGLAYLAGRGDDRVSSATMAATMTDFSDFGDFEVFVNADNVGALDSKASRKGYVESADLSRLFSLLRANDLIWSSAISSYLLAEKAVASDLLYWFSDGIGMPAKMLDTFQREILLENALTKPDRLKIGGTPIDVRKIRTPLCFVSLKDDHVANWEQTYRGATRFEAPKRFILGGSGHNAGTINPPAANKHGYWTNDALPSEPGEWLEKAERHEGSWWTEWASWLTKHSGPEVKARPVSAGSLPVLEAAPGSYARIRR